MDPLGKDLRWIVIMLVSVLGFPLLRIQMPLAYYFVFYKAVFDVKLFIELLLAQVGWHIQVQLCLDVHVFILGAFQARYRLKLANAVVLTRGAVLKVLQKQFLSRVE